MSKYLNWQLVKKTRIKDMDLTVLEYKHRVFGCPYAHIESSSRENAFAVALRTLPSDSTGLPHIMEHTVLAGSKKFPVKDPFFSMLNGSTASFMNAFTAKNWTAYPFATANRRDFYNLLDVYLDAVFFPRLDINSFLQEGIRLDIESGRLVYKGVVFNEMKGVYSSASALMEEAVCQAMYPNTPYRYDSGGDPREIIKLDYRRFLAFHKKYYHPSNALFYSFGSFNALKHFDFIENKVFRHFRPKPPFLGKYPEKRFNRPVRKVFQVPPARPGDRLKQVCRAWRLNKASQAEKVLEMEILEEALLNDEFGLAKNRLLESGLGSDLSDQSGYNTDFFETYFSLGLKDVEPGNQGKVAPLINRILKPLAEKGLPLEVLDAALNKLSISHLAVSSQPFPYGLSLWLRLINPWLYGASAASAINFRSTFRGFSRQLRADCLKTAVRRSFFLNPNKALLVLSPSKSYFSDFSKPIDQALARQLKKLSRSDKDAIENANQELKRHQDQKERPNILPALKPSQLTRHPRPLKHSLSGQAKEYRLFNNGLAGLAFSLDAPADDKQAAFLPLLSYVLPRLGPAGWTKEKWDMALSRSIGELSLTPFAYPDFKNGRAKPFLFVQFNARGEKIRHALSLVLRLLGDPALDRTSIISACRHEMRARSQASVLRSGHMLAASRAASGLDQSAYLREQWGGLSQLEFLSRLKPDHKFVELPAIRGSLAKGRNFLAGFAPAGRFSSLVKQWEDWDFGQKARTKPSGSLNFSGKKRELMVFNTNVNYVAAAFRTGRIGDQDAAALDVAARILSSRLFHPEIREKRGAYGAFALYDRISGLMSFASYRDPRLMATLDTFSRARDFLEQADFSSQALDEGIIKAVSRFDKPAGPEEALREDHIRSCLGISALDWQKERERLFKVKKQDIVRIAREYLKPKWQDYSVAAITSAGQAKKYAKKHGFKTTSF